MVLGTGKEVHKGLHQLQLSLTAKGSLSTRKAQKGSLLTKGIVDATRRAIKFLGNVSSHIIQERCRKIVGFLNSDIQDLVEKQELHVVVRQCSPYAVQEL